VSRNGSLRLAKESFRFRRFSRLLRPKAKWREIDDGFRARAAKSSYGHEADPGNRRR
jgi:hypothetical protein